MLSRLMWVALAGVALIAGIIFQSDRSFISFDRGSDKAHHQVIEASVGRSIESRIADHVTVIGDDGRNVEVSPETKRAMGKAVSELVAAKTELAFLRARDADPAQIKTAEARSDRARLDVDRLRDEINRQKDLSRAERDELRARIQNDVRQSVRNAIRG